jgi:hypothetical protein
MDGTERQILEIPDFLTIEQRSSSGTSGGREVWAAPNSASSA